MAQIKEKVPTESSYAKALERYANNVRAANSIIAKSEAKISKELSAQHEKLGTLPDDIKSDESIITTYLLAHKQSIFSQGKTITFKDGKIKLNAGQHKVDLGEAKEEDVIAALKKKELTVYIVDTESLDKKKMITDREDKELLKLLEKQGVKIVQNETIKIEVNP